jgi:ABC-2 type transport system permease protein
VVAALFGVAWAGLSNIVALKTRHAELTMMIGILLTFPILFLSTAMMPEGLLPEWLETVSRFNPITYVIDSARQLMNFGFDWGQVGVTLAVIVAVGSITLTGATRAFRKATR